MQYEHLIREYCRTTCELYKVTITSAWLKWKIRGGGTVRSSLFPCLRLSVSGTMKREKLSFVEPRNGQLCLLAAE